MAPGVYIKPVASKVSVLKQMKAGGVKPQAGQSLASMAAGWVKGAAGIAGALGVPGAGLVSGAAGLAERAFAGTARAGRTTRTYTAVLRSGSIIDSSGRVLGYTRKKAKKIFGRRRRHRWTKRDEKEWEYRLAIAKVGGAVVK